MTIDSEQSKIWFVKKGTFCCSETNETQFLFMTVDLMFYFLEQVSISCIRRKIGEISHALGLFHNRSTVTSSLFYRFISEGNLFLPESHKCTSSYFIIDLLPYSNFSDYFRMLCDIHLLVIYTSNKVVSQ